MRTAPPGVLPVIAIDRASPRPLYRQLYEGFRDAIVDRRLRAGQRLPSTRSLAAELRISRIPVLNAFEQLLAEGYFEARVGAGTFVAESLPDEVLTPVERRAAGWKSRTRSRPRVVARRTQVLLRDQRGPWLRGLGAFGVGQPPLDQFPLAEWSRLAARRARNPREDPLNYGPAPGLPSLREAVAEYLRTARAVRCEAGQVLIVSGSQQALEISARVLLEPDSPVWLEEPGYFGAQRVLKTAGVRVVPVRVDEEGLNVTSGRRRCPGARAAYVTPSHQFPLGVTMSATRRLQLLDWARESGSWIVEDDYDSEYRFGSLPIASLQGLDRDSRVIYIGTFTKILFPALRLGYLVVPSDLVAPFIEVRRAMDFGPPTFLQMVLTDFIAEGHFGRHIRRMRLVCQERRDALVEALGRELPELRVLGDPAGMYLAVAFPRGWRDRQIAERAALRNLWVAPLSQCYLGPSRRQGLILGYGGSSVEQIEAGVARLRDVIAAALEGAGAQPVRAGQADATPAGR